MIYERIDIFTSIEVLHNVHVPLHLNLNIQQFLVCVDRRNFTCCTSWTLTKKLLNIAVLMTREPLIQVSEQISFDCFP